MIAIEAMRVGRQDREAPVRNVATIETGRRRRDTNVGIGGMAARRRLRRFGGLRGRPFSTEPVLACDPIAVWIDVQLRAGGLLIIRLRPVERLERRTVADIAHDGRFRLREMSATRAPESRSVVSRLAHREGELGGPRRIRRILSRAQSWCALGAR